MTCGRFLPLHDGWLASSCYTVHGKRLPGPRVLEGRIRALLVRADLLIQVQKVIASRGLKQAEAAKMLHVTQPRVSDLLRGRIDLFSTDALIDMLARLGVGVKLVVRPIRPKQVA